MFSFIRRHQYLAMVFILLVIASFLIFFTDGSHMSFSGDNVSFGTIDGRKITRQEYLNARKDVMLSYLFRSGEWPRGNVEDSQITERLLLITRLKQHDLLVGDEAVALQVAQFFRPREGQGTVADNYRNFVETRLKPQGLSDADFRRFMRHELGINQLISLQGASGRLLTPAAAEAAYRHQNQQVETKAVIFLATNFVAKAKTGLDQAALQNYYSNQVANYNLPVRVEVSYVAFDALTYHAEASAALQKNTNLTAIIDQIYVQRGSNFYTDEKSVVLSPEKAKEKIRDDIRKEESLRLAQRKAYDFAGELDKLEPLNATNLVKVANQQGLKVFETEPFSVLDGPQGIKESAKFSRAAHSLNREQPFAGEPVRAGDAFYIMAFKGRRPSEPQPFEKVKAKVEADYVQFRAIQLAREAGNEFAAAVTNAVAAGKKFADVAQEKKVNMITIAPFGRQAVSIPELDAVNISPIQYRAAAFARRAGESSGFISAGQGGFVLAVEKFLPADEAKMKTELKEFTEGLRDDQARAVFSDWARAQIRDAGLADRK